MRKTQGYPRREGDNDPLKCTTLLNSFECCKENFVTVALENGTLSFTPFQLTLGLDFFCKVLALCQAFFILDVRPCH